MPIDTKILERLQENDVNLQQLDLSNKELTDADIQVLCAALKNNSTLKTLDLSNNTKITNLSLAHLATIQGLTKLSLNCTGITDRGLAHLTTMRGLTTLCLRGNISDASLPHLAAMQDLTTLYLFNTITDAGLAYLATMRGLTTLYIWSIEITDAGVAHLATMQGLTKLSLWSTAITNASLAHLATMQGTEIFLWNPKSTNASIQNLPTVQGMTFISALADEEEPVLTHAPTQPLFYSAPEHTPKPSIPNFIEVHQQKVLGALLDEGKTPAADALQAAIIAQDWDTASTIMAPYLPEKKTTLFQLKQ